MKNFNTELSADVITKLRERHVRRSFIPAKLYSDAYQYELSKPKVDENAYEFLTKVHNNIRSFVKQHKNLLIASNNTGNGKTSWAVDILLSYVDNVAYRYAYSKSRPIMFVNVPNFLDKKRKAFSDPTMAEEVREMEKGMNEADILVLDDIATKSASDFEKELLYVVINNRINDFKSTIYTSNITKDDLENVLSARIASRIIGESIYVEFKSIPLRGLIERKKRVEEN